MPPTRKKTDEVLASAQRELKAQLLVVRDEMSRLAAEERALTEALSSIDGDGSAASSAPTAGRAGARSARPAGARKRTAGARKRKATGGRRARGASKPTAERVKELEGLLADGPKSRNELAAALKVSPPRVQQLLAELGGAVSSKPDPGQRQGKLWSLKGRANGASAAKPAAKRARATKPAAKRATAPKPAAKRATAKSAAREATVAQPPAVK